MGALVGPPGLEDPGTLFARDTDEGRRVPPTQALPTNFQFVRALDPLRNLLDRHSSPREIAIHELPRCESLRSVRSIVSNCHTVHLEIGQVRGLGSHLAPGRHKIFFEQICGQCGRNKRSAVLNKITAPSDEPKMI